MREYETSKMAYRDIKNSVDTAKREGIAEGMEKGMKEGMELGIVKGKQEGLAEGMEKGMNQKALEIAKNMLAKGRSHGLGIVGKQRLHGAFTRDEAPHDVAAVGKDGPATALAAHHIDAFFAAEVEVYLLVGYLVAAHDYCGVQLPGKQEVCILVQRY